MAGGGAPSVGPASDGEPGPRSVQGTRWPPVGRGALGTARRQTRLGRTPTKPVCQAHGRPGVLPWGLTPAGRCPLTGPAGPGHSLGAAPGPPPRASRVRLPLQDPPTPCVCLWLAVHPQHVRTPGLLAARPQGPALCPLLQGDDNQVGVWRRTQAGGPAEALAPRRAPGAGGRRLRSARPRPVPLGPARHVEEPCDRPTFAAGPGGLCT